MKSFVVDEGSDLRVVKKKRISISRTVAIVSSLIIIVVLVTVLAVNVAVWSKSGCGVLTTQEYRLPGDVTPTHYDVSITISLEPQFLCQGSVRIETSCHTATSFITLHSKHHTVDTGATRVTHDDEDDTPVKVLSHEFNPLLDYMVVRLATALEPGHNYTLYFEFSGEIDGSLIGMYKSSYIDSAGNRHWLVATQLAAAEGRRMMPCFDEPALKATFTADVTHPDNLTALSNMPAVSSTPVSPGWVNTKFDRTVSMSLYLLTFVVSDFNYTESTFSDGRPFRVWCRPEAVNQTEYSLTTGVNLINFFETYFNIPYPLSKMDMVAMPDFAAGAMENWGLMLFRETALLLDPDEYTESGKQWIATIVSHELAHQWFGNLVTADWWSDIWLNEGFASYLEYTGLKDVEPTIDWDSKFVKSDMHSAFDDDYISSSPSIVRPVDTYDEINEIFGNIIYKKGASVLRMMEYFIGNDTMRKGLQYFLEEYSYSVADTDEFWAAMQKAVDEDGVDNIPDIKEVMDTWTRQAGYPYITIDTQAGDDIIIVTQKRFLLSNEPYYNSQTWYVPVTLALANHTDDFYLAWLDNVESATIHVSGFSGESSDWIIGNPELHNFYIVNYDDVNWQKLISTLATSWTAIPMLNRAALIRDAFNIAKLGEVNITTGFDVTSYLHQETEYLPLSTALSELSYVSRMLTTTAVYGAYREYLLTMLTPHYERLGWDEVDNNPNDQFIQNSVISWSCSLGLQTCVDNAVSQFKEWMDNPTVNSIDIERRSVVYCTAVSNGGVDQWQFLWDQYQSTADAHAKNSYRYGMSCTRIPWLLYRMLNAGLDTLIVKEQDYVSLVTSVAYSQVGATLTWNFFKNNYDVFYERYGDGLFSFGRIVLAVTYSFTTDYQLSELKLFVEDHSDRLGSGAEAFQSAISRVQLNQKWMANNYEDATRWLQDNGFDY